MLPDEVGGLHLVHESPEQTQGSAPLGSVLRLLGRQSVQLDLHDPPLDGVSLDEPGLFVAPLHDLGRHVSAVVALQDAAIDVPEDLAAIFQQLERTEEKRPVDRGNIGR